MTSEQELLQEAGRLFAREPRLIELQGERAVFVGDTHGDLQPSERIVSRYLQSGMTLVFLGDYVDRGPKSRENMLYLLEKKLEHPHDLFLLMGNHEGWLFSQFSPADFWLGLDHESAALYAETLAKLPLAATSANGIIALHGALPDVGTLEEINEIEPGTAPWRQVTWGDWADIPGDSLGGVGGRPQFGRGYFERLMDRFGKNLLIRSHQPNAPEAMFNGRCLTIFTSSAYGGLRAERTVAVTSLQGEIRAAVDVQLVTI